jgi:solute carrier family 13 (sodium-dependent dicarboxylate transporter), member 2/3/5
MPNGESLGKTEHRRLVLISAIVLIFTVLAVFMPAPAGLTEHGKITLSLMFAAVATWCLNVMPILLASAFFVVIQPVLGVAPLSAALSLFANAIVFFVLGMFCFSLALGRCGLSERLALWGTLKSGGNTKMLLLYLMCFGALLSTVIADIPVIAMLAPIALLILQPNGCDPRKNFGKALLIGLPLAALIGGTGTPTGSAMNFMTIQFIKDLGGVNINFPQWTGIGFPTVVLLTPLAWNFVVRIFPPEVEMLSEFEAVKEKSAASGPLRRDEIVFIVLMLINVVAWFTEPWHKTPLPVMAVIGATLLFLPGVNLLDWSYARNRIGWEALFINGATCSLGMVMWKSGAAAWIGQAFLGSIMDLSVPALVALVSAFTVVAHLVVPNNAPWSPCSARWSSPWPRPRASVPRSWPFRWASPPPRRCCCPLIRRCSSPTSTATTRCTIGSRWASRSHLFGLRPQPCAS